MGPLGRAMSPGQATDYPVVPDLPGFADTFPRIFHLGEVRSYQPHVRMVSRVTFDPERAPVLGDFQVDGGAAVPLGILLESAVRGAEWIVPEDFPALRAGCLEQVVVPLGMLRLEEARPCGSGRCAAPARGHLGGRRAFPAAVGRRVGPGGEPAGRPRAGRHSLHRPAPARCEADGHLAFRSAPAELAFIGGARRRVDRGPDSRRTAVVRPCAPTTCGRRSTHRVQRSPFPRRRTWSGPAPGRARDFGRVRPHGHRAHHAPFRERGDSFVEGTRSSECGK
ncbi:hypothetical protein NKH18_14390 [Streptomyces sp. M10(2022)]